MNKKQENQKQKIQELVFQIENDYKEASNYSYEKIKEIEDREKEIEKLKERLNYIRNENEDLQQLANDSLLQNSYLKTQIEDSELESQQNQQIIQQMNLKINYLSNIKQNLENMNHRHSFSIENANILEQNNDEYKQKLEQNNIQIQKIDTEIQFSKERLEALLKKYQQLMMNEKNIKELQNCLQKEKNKYNKQVSNLSLQNSQLQSQVQDMHNSFVQIKQEAKANKEPRQQHTLAQIAQILTPEDFDRKPKYNLQNSETSCKTFHLFQESSFMNKIKVTDFQASSNIPDNESDCVSFLSMKPTHSVQNKTAQNQNNGKSFQINPISMSNNNNNNINKNINQTTEKSNNISINKQQNQIQSNSSKQSNHVQFNQQQQNYSKQQQPQSILTQSQQNQQKQIYPSNQSNQVKQVQQKKINNFSSNNNNNTKNNNFSPVIKSQYKVQHNNISQQGSNNVQNQQKQIPNKQQQQQSQQLFKSDVIKTNSSTPQNQQNSQRLFSKNVQISNQNSVKQQNGSSTLEQQQQINIKKKIPINNIYESQVIQEKPQQYEETPIKKAPEQVKTRNRIAASVQESSSGLINSFKISNYLKENSFIGQRQKSNSFYQNLMIGAGVVAASAGIAAAGLAFYKLVPKKQ